MTPTRIRVLVALAAIAAALGWGALTLVEGQSGRVIPVPWLSAATMWVLTVALFIWAVLSRPRLQRAEGAKPMPPLVAARTAALAMAASRVGALVGGFYLGLAMGAFGRRVSEAGSETLLSACERTDQPVAALIRDLRQRGLLDDTLVIWGGEFGRTPTSQKIGNEFSGRDHNMQGFTTWMAGGGLKRGFSFGETDELGHKAVVDPVSVPDFHATILHALGLDAERLHYERNGLEERLTGFASPRVVQGIFA